MIRRQITLRDYQQDIVDGVRGYFAQGVQRVLAVAPTGSGKTVVFSHIARNTAERKKKVLILAHRIELLEQCGDKLYSNYVDFGYINPRYTPDPTAYVQVGSMQTVIRRLQQLGFYPDLIIIDECHLVVNKTYMAIINYFQDAYVLGVTATPIRSDGKPLGDIFKAMVLGPQIQELIKRKHLVEPITYVPAEQLDFSGIDVESSGDFNQHQLAEFMDNKYITGDAVHQYSTKCAGKPAIAFCVNIKHSQHVAQQFCAAGWRWAHVDGTMPAKQRKHIFNALATGELHGASSVDLATTGLDVPPLAVAIMLRATEAEGLFIQMGGRVLRTHPGKDFAYILDHAGCTIRHGLITDNRDWTLTSDEKKEKKKKRSELRQARSQSMKQCPSCDLMHHTSASCPGCGHSYAVNDMPTHRPGELVEVNADTVKELMKRQANAKEISNARTLEDFERIEKKNGYREGWAKFAFDSRNKKISLY